MNREKERKEIPEKYKWDLSDYYQNAKAFDKDCEEVLNSLKDLVKYKGELTKTGKTLYEFLIKKDEVDTLIEKIYCFAIFLNYNTDVADGKNQKIKAKAENTFYKYISELSFVDTELIKVNFKKLIKEEPKLQLYQRYFEIIEKNKPYILSEKEEKILAEVGNVLKNGRTIYDCLMSSDADFGKIKDENGKLIQVTKSNYSSLMRSKDRNVRKRAYKAKNGFYKKFMNTICYTYKGSINAYFFKTKIRGFKTPLDKNVFEEEMSTKVYNTLINIIGNNTEGLKKFNDIKSKLLKIKPLHFYDYKAIPELGIKDEITYDNAVKNIKEALKIMGEDYSKNLVKFLDNKMIDVYPYKNKYNNGFQAGSYKLMPRILYNYKDSYQDYYGLAHEIGHAMHTYYADKKQPFIYHDYSLILAETASLVNEVLLTNHIITNAKTKNEKIFCLLKLIEEIDNYLFGTTRDAEHEKAFYDAEMNNNSLSAEEMCQINYDLMQKYYGGKNFVIDDEEKYSWMHYGHYHSPYYFYKYAIGMCAALIIGKNIIDDIPGFKEKYLNFLSVGSSENNLEIYKNIGINLEDEKTYYNAINYFKDLVNQLEKLINE